MARRELSNKPLVEAIFELRWKLQEQGPGINVDPHYKILVGRMYDKLSDKYPIHEPLPSASLPDEIAGYIVQHRFRKEENGWPLIQLGPGIITLNSTAEYKWEGFEAQLSSLVDLFFSIYPRPGKPQISDLILRYIDAIDFNFDSQDIFLFLKEKMKIDVNIYQSLFEDTGVVKNPLTFDLKFSFPSTSPKGAVHLRFAKGARGEVEALIWETMFQSQGEDVPQIKQDIQRWAEGAHNIASDWFFKIIEGELERGFE